MKIFCDNCNKPYKDLIDFETKQANRCSSEVILENKTKIIYSNYGSDYDTSRHIANQDSDIKIGLICDLCIAELIRKKEIIEDTNYDYFHKLSDTLFQNDEDFL